MTHEAQAGRDFIQSAIAIKEAAATLGISDPAQVRDLLNLGKTVAQFVGSSTRSLNATRFEKVLVVGHHAITRDSANGLEWDITDFHGERMTFEKAQKACADLRTGGHTDWRLPTVQELLTLVDYTRSGPAIDKEFFPNCKSDWYRTSTPYAPLSGFAWGVSFLSGGSGIARHDGGHFVRAVRASQS